jgi:hypothetical protein
MDYDFNGMSLLIAQAHEISVSNLTKFQARLKNLHRMGWPLNFRSVKGKASSYCYGDVLDMSLAVELMQLGLTPERLIQVLRSNRWATLMAYLMAARTLAASPTDFLQRLPAAVADEDSSRPPFSMFVYFDPTALMEFSFAANEGPQGFGDGLQADEDLAVSSFFYAGGGVVTEMIANWNSLKTRLSLINISSVMSNLAINRYPEGSGEDIAYREFLFGEMAAWADRALDQLEGRDAEEEAYALNFITLHDVTTGAQLTDRTGIELERSKKYINRWMEAVAEDRSPNGQSSGETDKGVSQSGWKPF